MLTHINTISVQVSDQDKALDFYVNKLGMEKIQDSPMSEEERWLTVAPPGSQPEIVLTTQDIGGMSGFKGLIFGTEDIAATVEELEARGVNITVPLSVEFWGKWVQFADPDGNEFGIWAPADEM